MGETTKQIRALTDEVQEALDEVPAHLERVQAAAADASRQANITRLAARRQRKSLTHQRLEAQKEKDK